MQDVLVGQQISSICIIQVLNKHSQVYKFLDKEENKVACVLW